MKWLIAAVRVARPFVLPVAELLLAEALHAVQRRNADRVVPLRPANDQ